ncbi:MAG: alpha-glucuronidase [Bacteroidetes bacterium]|nr:alpha-glucuronidase [Bacteroidota bacterium]
MKNFLFLLLAILCQITLHAEDGYRLWLRYDKVDAPHLTALRIEAAPVAQKELTTALEGLLGKPLPLLLNTLTEGTLLVGTPARLTTVAALHLEKDLAPLGEEGFLIRSLTISGKHVTLVTANTDNGLLYGIFHFLRLIQTQQSISDLNISSAPSLPYRILDHWDNLNRTVERGYAGFSIFNWFTLPGYLDQRYTDYARANASIGINGTVLNNVNASPLILTSEYLEKAAALAGVFRPYGIRVYLSVNFASPITIGGLRTADPLDPAVQDWWKKKTDEVYKYIPDFGGFLVKANSEGQPGPQNYGRTHADGANMLADALAPHKGIVMWRAFVYSESSEDRAKQAYNEFKPLDGLFRKNVWVQVKNGPIDFQPREPYHPLFGAMPRTPLMLEFQLTQEYLGFSTHLAYLAPLFRECLDAGPPVSSAITGMAGVANIGNDIDWCGHPFGQANWYAFGRLAWDQHLSSGQIADEWIRQTFSNNPAFVDTVKRIMLASREAIVDYMTPLGLHHIMGYGHHYGPAPWYNKAPRADWNPVYFHRADSAGIGFDRTATGSNALEQYPPDVRALWENADNCPDRWLLWWHHVAWDHRMHTGRTLWEELCHKYYTGVDSVRWMEKAWNAVKNDIDQQRARQISMLLSIQEHEAAWWRDACLLYFQTFSRQPLPAGAELPAHTLDYYEKLNFNNAPGTLR